MELINQVTSTQFLFPAIAVAGVLIGAVLLFVFGFKAAEQPQFDKLPLVVDDRKGSSKKRKTKEKKASNGQVVHEAEVKSKKVSSESSKKSPIKEKSKEQAEKNKEKTKEKNVEVKVVEKKTPKKEAPKPPKQPKQPIVKPADFDDGDWEKVPTKNDKKSRKVQDEPKKDSPTKDKKKNKEIKKEETAYVSVSVPALQNNEAEKRNAVQIDKELQEKVNELQRVLNEVEERERSQTPVKVQKPSAPVAVSEPEVNDKKKEEKAPIKNSKKDHLKDSDEFVVPEVSSENGAVFDELGDVWTDAKVPKKGKKKARKDQ